MAHAIEVKNLTVTIPGRKEPLFAHVNMAVDEGQIVALVGLSGCGKSVLAKTISGIIPHIIKMEVEGDAYLFGANVQTMSGLDKIETIGYIFQNPDHQICTSQVEAELAFGPENLGIPKEEIEKRVSKALAQVGMESYRYAHTQTLSGGEKQLIALASVLTLEPKILICDEILGPLDMVGCHRIKELLQELRREGMTIFIIEHDWKKLHFVDKTFLLEHGRVGELER